MQTTTSATTIAVVGAGGFLGKNLTAYLLDSTDSYIKAIFHRPPEIYIEPRHQNRLTPIQGDVYDVSRMTEELRGVDTAYYFIHMMGQHQTGFSQAEARAADCFVTAVRQAGVGRVVFMGGLGKDGPSLSEHLVSRHTTGEILRAGCPLVIEFRASMIIGSGSVAFDIIDSLVRKLPLMALPSFAGTLTQPIGLRDVLRYLDAARTIPLNRSTVVEIGGPERLSYRDLYRRYAGWLGKRQLLIPVPFVPVGLAGHWLDLFTPRIHARIGRIMVASMANEMIVTEPDAAQRIFPDINPRPLTAAFEDIQSLHGYDRTAAPAIRH